MKKFRTMAVFFIVCLVVSIGYISVSANGNEVEVKIPIISVGDDATEIEINEAINKAIEVDVKPYASVLVIKPFLIRSGSTSSCQLYLRWSCPGHQCSMISFDLLKLHNNSILFPVTYANIGGSTIYCETGASGSAFVRNVTIPTSVSNVYVKLSNVKAYILTEGWISTVSFSGQVPFN